MKKFLIIQTAFIGDVILATAVAEKLHAHYPDAIMDFMVRKGNETLLAQHPFLRKVLVWNKKEHKYKDLFRLLKEVRKEKYDHVINLQRFAASGFITAFSGAKETAGFNKNPFSFLFSRSFPHEIGSVGKPGKHEVERCLRLIDHLTPPGMVKPRIYPSENDFDAVKEFLPNTFITISPASVWFTKQLPADRWIDFISQQQKGMILLTGGPGDVALCETIKERSENKNVINLAGKLSLLQSAALMSKAIMNYCNDSAPLHLCSAMNAPVTAVFCSTIPEFGFGPLSDVKRIVQTDIPLDCKPCGLHGHHACPRGHFKCSVILPAQLAWNSEQN